MDWDDLRFFLAIYRAGSTSGAARALSVQHTTVGRRLSGLEETLGTTLFTRTPTGLVPTPDAEGILMLAEDAERSMTAIERAAHGGDTRIEGVVRLTTSEAFSGYFVRRLAKLYTQHPGLVVEVLSGNRLFDVGRGEADLAVRIAPTTQLDLICRCIGHAGWSLYASENYVERHGALSEGFDFTGHEVIGFDESLKQVPGALWLSDHAGGAQTPMRGNSINAVVNAAVVGIGIAAVPCFLAEPEPTLRRLTPALIGTREIWLVFHPDVKRIARVRRVIDFVADEVAADAELLAGTGGRVSE